MSEMHILTVAINKGGAGKTTTSKSFATSAVEMGLNVLILDMDAQQNSVQWGRRRQAFNPLPIVLFVNENDLETEIHNAKKAGFDLVIIDTPPGRSSETLAAIEVSDMVIIPFEPDVDHFEGIKKILRVVNSEGKPAIGVLNKSQPNSQGEIATSETCLSALGLRFSPIVIHRYQIHKEANMRGLTAQEIDPTSKAALEIAQLWKFVYAELLKCKIAQLQN